MPVTADQLRDLFALGLAAETVLEVVAIFERDASRYASRSVTIPNRSKEAIRAERYRNKLKQNKALAGANDAANGDSQSVTEQRDASRYGVTERCDLSSLLTTESQSGIREVSKKDTSSIVEGRRARVSRGTRLDKTSRLSDDDRQFARDNGMTEARIDQSWAEFIDYWISVPGQRGVKLDWSATWRNRVRTISTKQGGPNGQRLTGGARQSGGDAFLAGLASVAARISGNDPMARPAPEEVPLGRFNIDGF
jgi:hypothetical protein